MLANTKQFQNRAGWPFSVTQTVGGLGTLGLAALLLTQSPFAVIGLIVGLAAFVWILRKPEWGLYLLIISVPGQLETSLTFGTTRISLTQVAVGLAFVGWFASRVIHRQPLVPSPIPKLLPFFALYLSVMLLSVTVAQSTGEALNELSRWLISAFAYLLTTSIIKTRRQFWTLIGFLCAGPIIEGLIGIQQQNLKNGPPSYFVDPFTMRVFGTFSEPNPFAGYVETALPFIIALLLVAWQQRNLAMRNWLKRETPDNRRAMWRGQIGLIGLIAATYVVGVAILWSFSRGSWLGLAAGAVAMVLVRGKKSLPIIFIAGTIISLLLAGLQTGAIPASTFGRLTSVGDEFRPFDVRTVLVTDNNFAVVERMAMWQAGGNMFLYNPWLGVGIGNYNTRYPDFNMPAWPESRGHAHNYYIQAAAETGVLGLAAYLLLTLAALLQSLRLVRQTTDPLLRYVAWSVLGVIMIVATHNLVEDLHVLNMGIQWSAILALLHLIERTEEESLKV